MNLTHVFFSEKNKSNVIRYSWKYNNIIVKTVKTIEMQKCHEKFYCQQK